MSDTDSLDNTNAVAHIIETGDTEEIQMILGSRDRVRHAGVIRPGIKRPVASCSAAQKALYEKMFAEGFGFKEIDFEMLKLEAKNSTRKSCLTPTNSNYFTVNDSDFKNAADAQYIRSHYADEDGQVRKLPIWFASDDISQILPHNFRAFDGMGNVRAVSFYDGNKLKFRYIPKDTKLPAKPEEWLILDSDDEDEATKACGYKVQFGGMIRCFVPGIRSAGEIVIPTRSWTGLSESVAVLKRVRAILGRFNNLYQGAPFLEMVKYSETIRHEGKPVKQWISAIQLSVDPMVLAQHAGETLARGKAAMQLFNSPPAAAAFAAAHVTPAPTPAQPETKAEEKKEAAGDVDDVVEKARSAIQSLGAKAGLAKAEIDAFYELSGGKKKADTKDAAGLRYLYGALRKALGEQDGPAKVKEAVKKYLPGPAGEQQLDPEIEAMINEIMMLAENADLDTTHIRAHMTAVTGGVAPEDQGLEELQQFYREIEARINNDKDIFAQEILADFEMGG
jgi:hypothetical protein